MTSWRSKWWFLITKFNHLLTLRIKIVIFTFRMLFGRLKRDRVREIITAWCAYHKGISFKMAHNDALSYNKSGLGIVRACMNRGLAWWIPRGRIPFAECEISSFFRRFFRIDRRRERPIVISPVGKDSGHASSSSSSRVCYDEREKGRKAAGVKSRKRLSVRCGANSSELARA